MDTNQRLLEQAYHAFNDRDIDGALALMHPDVEWANGLEGGSVQGHNLIKALYEGRYDLSF